MYVCEYLVGELPFDKPVVVGVTMRSPRDPSTQPWMDGSESQPTQGQKRVIVDGRRSLQLTATAPRASLVFEMVYAPLGLTEVPPQQPSPLLRVLPRAEAMQETHRMRAPDRAQDVERASLPPQP